MNSLCINQFSIQYNCISKKEIVSVGATLVCALAIIGLGVLAFHAYGSSSVGAWLGFGAGGG